MARNELEPWGGDLRLPRWLRRWRKDPGDTPEKLAEPPSSKEPERSVLENADRAMGSIGLGSWMYNDLPDEHGHRHER